MTFYTLSVKLLFELTVIKVVTMVLKSERQDAYFFLHMLQISTTIGKVHEP